MVWRRRPGRPGWGMKDRPIPGPGLPLPPNQGAAKAQRYHHTTQKKKGGTILCCHAPPLVENASTRELGPAHVDQAASLEVQIAQASALAPGAPVDLGKPVTSRGQYTTPVQLDPFAVSVEDKLGLLLQAEAAMARVPGARLRYG